MKVFVHQSLTQSLTFFFFSLISLKLKFIELSLYNKISCLMFFLSVYSLSQSWVYSYILAFNLILKLCSYNFIRYKICVFYPADLLPFLFIHLSVCLLFVWQSILLPIFVIVNLSHFLNGNCSAPMNSLSLFVQFVLIQF